MRKDVIYFYHSAEYGFPIQERETGEKYGENSVRMPRHYLNQPGFALIIHDKLHSKMDLLPIYYFSSSDMITNQNSSSAYMPGKHLQRNYPYFKKRQADLNNQPMGELLEQILALFEVSFSQYEAMDFETQYLFQHDLLDSLVPVIRKHINADAYGRKEMPNLEKVINDLENFREDHYLRIYAEDVLRKRFLETPPLGKTKADIYRMSAEELIDLDMDPRLVKR